MLSRARFLSSLFSPSTDTAAGLPSVVDVSGLVDSDYILARVGPNNKSGTVVGNNLDLSTGNFFEVTADDQTLTFSNPPDVHGFTIKVTGAGIVRAYDISAASYDSVSFSVQPQEVTPTGLAFNPDGTKMFIIGFGGNTVFQYTLTTGFNVSTASYDSVSFTSAQAILSSDLAFNPDGTKMFIMGQNTRSVFQYNLTTGFDISTASYDGASPWLAAQDGTPKGLAFNPDGTKMFVVGTNSDSVYQYTLTTAFDVSTASYDSVSFSVGAQDGAPYDLAFNPDGTKMLIIGNNSDSVYRYNLTTGFDISTASYDSASFSVGAQDGGAMGLAFNPDGTKMFIIGNNSDSVHQYTTGSFTTATITYPPSVNFESGSPPAVPAIGAVKTVDLYTVNGGTNYYDRG